MKPVHVGLLKKLLCSCGNNGAFTGKRHRKTSILTNNQKTAGKTPCHRKYEIDELKSIADLSSGG
jgi:hypothetical protein